MIEWKAVIIYSIFGVLYILYRRARARPTEPEPEQSITAEQKLLINELSELTAQHTNLLQFLFDAEQEKESRYNISYKTADNTTKTAEIIKAVDSTAYIQALAQQQITALESRINAIIKELNKPHPPTTAATNKSVSVADTSIIKELQRISREVFKGDSLKRGTDEND